MQIFNSFSLQYAYSRYIVLISPLTHFSFPFLQYCTIYIQGQSKIKLGLSMLWKKFKFFLFGFQHKEIKCEKIKIFLEH